MRYLPRGATNHVGRGIRLFQREAVPRVFLADQLGCEADNSNSSEEERRIMTIGLPDVVTVLSAISSIAVIAGAGFIVLQLRQNSRLIRASIQQQKADAAFSILEKITDESFARRRSNMYEVV